MANHLRRQIRERAATTLTGLATTGSNVFQSRFYPMESAGLPGLCIYTKDETAEITLSLWNEDIEKVQVGTKLKIGNGYTNSFRGEVKLNVGRYGTLDIL